MNSSARPLSRRGLLRAAAAFGAGGGAALLAACGGGGGDRGADDPNAPPEVLAFEADPPEAAIGAGVRLTARFRGATARIEPGLGAVRNGQTLGTPALDRDTTFRLVVETPGQPAASRSLAVAVRYRDRYAAAAQGVAMSQHAAVAAADGSVILIGGSRGQGTLSDAVDRWSPEDGSLRRIGSLAGGRALHCATRLGDGRILVSGGAFSLGDWRGCELVDERSGAVSATGPLSVPRVEHAALALPDGRVLVVGGTTSGERPRQLHSDSAELWEPQTQRFRRVAQRMAIGRAGHSLSLLPDGRVLVVGGYTGSNGYCLAEVFDPRDESFTPLPAAGVLRANHAAHALADGRVLVLGGETAAPGSLAIEPLASVLCIDAATGAATELPPLLQARTLAGTALLPSGEVLLFGGQQEVDHASASAERYSPARGAQVIAGLDMGRAWHTVTRLPGGRVLVFGGETDGGAYVPTAWLYE